MDGLERVLGRLDGALFLKKGIRFGENFSALFGMGVLKSRIQTLWCTNGHAVRRVEAASSHNA